MKYLHYNESKPRGTLDFPIELYHVDAFHPQYKMPYHWHVDYELIRILEGELILTLDGVRHTARTGDILWVGSGVLHGGEPERCVYECLVFDMHMLMKQKDACLPYLQRIAEHAVTIFSQLPADADLNRNASVLFTAMARREDGSPLIVQGALYQLLGIVFQKGYYTAVPPQNSSVQRNIALLKKLLTFMENEFVRPLSLEELSRLAGMSPKYFCRFFRNMTQRTPVDYLNYYRIEQACRRLISGDQSVTEIALSCGFNDLSYFIRTFKKYKGMTPKAYIHHSLASSG